MRGAPASRVAKTPGWPSVGTLVTDWNPASRTKRIIISQPSAMPRFSAAIDGCLTHSCKRCTPSAWRFTISACTGSLLSVAAKAKRGATRAVADVVPAAARNSRREKDGMAQLLECRSLLRPH